MAKLERNLIDNILESEVKLGRTNTGITFYYPESSLTELLECTADELRFKTEEFSEKEKDRLGNVVIAELVNEKGRFAVRIPKEGVDWVAANFRPSDFMKAFVEEIRKPNNTLAKIAEFFQSFSPEILISKVSEDEWAFSFCDDSVDPYVYHIEQNVFGLEYHRFTKESYRKLMKEKDK